MGNMIFKRLTEEVRYSVYTALLGKMLGFEDAGIPKFCAGEIVQTSIFLKTGV